MSRGFFYGIRGDDARSLDYLLDLLSKFKIKSARRGNAQWSSRLGGVGCRSCGYDPYGCQEC